MSQSAEKVYKAPSRSDSSLVHGSRPSGLRGKAKALGLSLLCNAYASMSCRSILLHLYSTQTVSLNLFIFWEFTLDIGPCLQIHPAKESQIKLIHPSPSLHCKMPLGVAEKR